MNTAFRQKICVCLLAVLACGCARVPVVGPVIQENDRLKAEITRLETMLSEREKELNAVREVLRQKEETLLERESRIEQLRRQLESVGIFGG